MSATFSPVVTRVLEGREVECHEGSDFDVNVSNRNLSLLLTELGFEFDDCGTLDPRELRAAIGVRQALGVTLPNGMPTITEGIWVDCGVAPGYIERQLERLRELAEFCEGAGVMVGWA